MVLRLSCPLEPLGRVETSPHPNRTWTRDWEHLQGRPRIRSPSVVERRTTVRELLFEVWSVDSGSIQMAWNAQTSHARVNSERMPRVKYKTQEVPPVPVGRVVDGHRPVGLSDQHSPDFDDPGWSEQDTWPRGLHLAHQEYSIPTLPEDSRTVCRHPTGGRAAP